MPLIMWVSLVYVLVFTFCKVVADYHRFAKEGEGAIWIWQIIEHREIASPF